MKKILMIILPLLLASCSYFKSSKEIELIPYAQKEKYGYFDLEGKIVINPQFGYATAFREGIALVKTTGEKGKWGFIDKSGKFVINATYKDATVFQEGVAWVVTDNGAPSAIDHKGEIKFVLKEAENVRLFSEDLAAFSKVDSTATIWGFVDKFGKQVINPQFDEGGDFHDGKCAGKNKEGKWGYIDKSGKIVINHQFNSAAAFKDGKAVVSLDEKAGVIDNDGKYIINPQFGYAYADGDKYLIGQDNKFGWCDNEGKFVINPQFDDAVFIGEDLLAYMYDYSTKGSINSDYLDTDLILKVINLNNPENLSFEDDCQTILNKTGKTLDDFTVGDTHAIFENKKINNEAAYGFAVMGNLKAINYDTYAYYVPKEKPQGFIYGMSLSGKASGKAEAVEKAFEKKLNGYNLMKKGYIDGAYSCVYKNSKNIVVISNNGLSNPSFYVLKKDFDISAYLNKIVQKSEGPTTTDNVEDYDSEVIVDSSAVVFDTTAVVIDTTAY